MKASLTAHLEELRRRLLSVLLCLLFATILSYPLSKPLLSVVKSDLLPDTQVVVLAPQSAVLTYVKVSVLLGFALSLPVLMYHLWVFVSPGLLRREKTLAAYILAPSLFLFLLGVSFGYFILLPVSLGFLIQSASQLAVPMLSLEETFTFIGVLLLGLGFVFQLPLVSAALTKFGLINASTLAKYRRHAVLGIFLFSAVITDPSLVTQVLVAVPFLFLYEVGILSSKVVGGR